MKKYLLIFGMLLGHSTFAQISNIDMNGAPARLSGYTNVEGSPYLFEDWARADISFTNAGLKENVAYKFNVHDNELEVINEAGNKIFLTKDFIEYALLERPSIIIANGSESGLLTKLLVKKGFDMINGVAPSDLVNVLAEGSKYTLVRKFYSDLVTPPKNSYAPTPGQMFVYEESFYLINANGEVESVRTRTNNIIKALDEKDQSMAKKFVKENDLNLSREDHLVIFFQKLNEA
ncbi:hypothetical protein [Algoriphagus namhaensis]